MSDTLRKTLISPSILTADFGNIGEAVRKLEKAKADYVHCDVMDGHFVPNLTFGSKFVSDLKKYTKLPLDVHLMISRPDLYIERFADAGADIITFHKSSKYQSGYRFKSRYACRCRRKIFGFCGSRSFDERISGIRRAEIYRRFVFARA